jgi:hypothetical protein
VSSRSRLLDGQSTPQHGAPSLHPLLRLQQRIGNRAVAGMVQANLQTRSDNPTFAGARVIQRQPKSDGPSLRDVPILLERLELDAGNNLLDYGHHLYRAATLFRDDPNALKEAFGRYVLGANVLEDTYRFFGVKPDTAGKLALGTGIVTKGVTFLRSGELTLDFQFDIGRGVKLETNLNLELDRKDRSDVRKAEVHVGFVRRF